MQSTYPIRLDSSDKRLFKRAARMAGLSLAEFIRRAAREKAKPAKKEAACLSYPDIEVDPEAETNPKEFIRKQLARKNGRHS
jgi:Ribbon-helix-helix protein, copG family